MSPWLPRQHHPPTSSYVLCIRYATKGDRAQRTSERAKFLVRGIALDREALGTSQRIPKRDEVSENHPERQLTSVFTGQPGGAPRRNRTGDPILTMDVLCRLS
jgi:hypothetical protein